MNKTLELHEGAPMMGKTTKLIQQKFQPYNMCYIVPSRAMVEQYFNNIKDFHNKRIPMIDGKNLGNRMNVAESIYRHMKTSEQSFIITSEGYSRTKNEWFEEFGFNICHDDPANKLDTKRLRFSSQYDINDYFKIDTDTLKITLKNDCDENDGFPNDEFTTVLNMIKTGRVDAFIIEANEEKPKVKNEASKHKEYSSIWIILIPTEKFYPEVGVKLLGHRIKDNLFLRLHGDSRLVDAHDVVLREDIKTKSINVYYFDENNNTRARKEANPEIYENRIAYLVDNLRGQTGILSNTYDDWNIDEAWHEISSNPHGRNDLMFLDNIIISMTAHMKKSFHKAVIEHTNGKLTDDDIFYYRNAEMYFQAVMRTKIRNNDTFQGADIYCMDHRTAIYLKAELEQYYGHKVSIKKINGYETVNKSKEYGKRKTIWNNDNEKVKASNMKKKAKQGYYSESENNKVLMLLSDNKTKRQIKDMPLWNKVTATGLFKK